jgi:hypothetical protein
VSSGGQLGLSGSKVKREDVSLSGTGEDYDGSIGELEDGDYRDSGSSFDGKFEEEYAVRMGPFLSLGSRLSSTLRRSGSSFWLTGVGSASSG